MKKFKQELQDLQNKKNLKDMGYKVGTKVFETGTIAPYSGSMADKEKDKWLNRSEFGEGEENPYINKKEMPSIEELLSLMNSMRKGKK